MSPRIYAPEELAPARALAAFVDASPTPFHACADAARRLDEARFRRVEESQPWPRAVRSGYVVRGASLVAWAQPEAVPPEHGFRVVGAHTDSPNLRVKPRPDVASAGLRQLGVEVYGGVLLNSWLDRDLGLAGRVVLRGERGPEGRLFRIQRPVLRIPQLAIHLDRDVNDKGLVLNRQRHLAPLWATAERATPGGFRAWLAAELEVEADALLAWDAMCHDVQPATLLGPHEEFLSGPRLDNLCSCHAGIEALLTAAGDPDAHHPTVLALFDHEEVGSVSSRGASSPLLRDVLERLVLARGGSRDDYHRAVAGSVCASADMAHATHPNYPDRHEPEHAIAMNGGPVIKVNTNQRYASEGETEALFQEACRRADVPFQQYVNRTDLACGSTIGPLTAASIGLRTVDVGVAQLAMHSARELCGAADPGRMARALAAFCAR